MMGDENLDALQAELVPLPQDSQLRGVGDYAKLFADLFRDGLRPVAERLGWVRAAIKKDLRGEIVDRKESQDPPNSPDKPIRGAAA